MNNTHSLSWDAAARKQNGVFLGRTTALGRPLNVLQRQVPYKDGHNEYAQDHESADEEGEGYDLAQGGPELKPALIERPIHHDCQTTGQKPVRS